MNDRAAELAIVVPSHIELDPADSGLSEVSYWRCGVTQDAPAVSRGRQFAAGAIVTLGTVQAALRHALSFPSTQNKTPSR